MKAWMVRCGSGDEREDNALKDGMVFAGWPEVPSLEQCSNRDEIEQVIREQFPTDSQYLIGNWTGQLHRFVHLMNTGDLVVMPLKKRDGFAIGRIESEYSFAGDASPWLRHRRNVAWHEKPIPKTSIRNDLRASLGALLTICELTRNDAAQRLEHVLIHGTDSGDRSSATNWVSDFDAIQKQDLPLHTTLRNMLDLVGQVRRSPSALDRISTELDSRSMQIDEDTTAVEIDDILTISAVDASTDDHPEPGNPKLRSHDSNASRFSPPPYVAISQIPSARHVPLAVDVMDTIRFAKMTMLRHNYSQLPVTRDGAVVGALTWEALANGSANSPDAPVRAIVIPDPPTFDHRQPVEELMPAIDRFGYVFVKGEDGSVCGLVTTSDLVSFFSETMIPLMRIEEIELRLRRTVRQHLSDDDVRRSNARASSLVSLTLGMYSHLFNSEGIWAQLNWPEIDKDLLCADLGEVAELRNRIAHFSADNPLNDDMERLEGVQRVLRALSAWH